MHPYLHESSLAHLGRFKMVCVLRGKERVVLRVKQEGSSEIQHYRIERGL